ncbi:uncharacterized protein LOC126999911 isoform X1 [Eriocheir sinensis]|uniref:uncharacterized protein LOC126999911 isoform X1 n=1 Tax=Eriocheir sinensis TaxID=95602 RepID=UPI0021C57FAF|nr:uncharacterized protein LOC126999911 isoform X1 [Eriocheir sinensis]
MPKVAWIFESCEYVAPDAGVCKRLKRQLRRAFLRQVMVVQYRLPGPLLRWATWCRRVSSILMSSHRRRPNNGAEGVGKSPPFHPHGNWQVSNLRSSTPPKRKAETLLREPHSRYRAMLMSSFITAFVIMLSVPVVPEKFLGIRTPAKVLESFNNRQNNSSFKSGDEGEGVLPQQTTNSKAHNIYKRFIPHKFWARARPHNKFKRKKHKVHGNSVNHDMIREHLVLKNK